MSTVIEALEGIHDHHQLLLFATLAGAIGACKTRA